MAGQLLGISVEEITSLMPGIEAFAEIGDYIDQAVRVYSSGMQMRLAFSLATARRPDVLIVDEALSVGDAYFQHKSFDRIREFRKLGTTLLIVSHDKGAIQSICDRAILLNAGEMVMQGAPEEVMDYYNALIAQKENSKIEQIVLNTGKVQTISGTGEAKVEEIGLYNDRGEKSEIVGVGDIVELRIKVKVHQDIPCLVLGYGIKDRLGQWIFGANTWHTQQIIESPKANDTYHFIISFPANLGVGSYSVQTALVDSDTHLSTNYEWCDHALVFNVINISKQPFAGCAWIDSHIEILTL
jgi:lipopolysaccharide transport system ATP-binding protein